MKFKIKQGFYTSSLSSHRADLGLRDTWWWQPDVGGCHWWLAKWPENTPRTAALETGQGLFWLSLDPFEGFGGGPWWGMFWGCWRVAVGGSGWPKKWLEIKQNHAQ